MTRSLAATIVAAILLPLPSSDVIEAAPQAKRKRCEIVVFKRKGKTIRRCRLKRVAPPAPSAALAPPPSPVAVGLPQPGAPAPGPQQPPPAPQPKADAPAEQPPARDPWFLTLHARDVGNGDFRLTPAIGSIPAGTLYLGYKNDDASEHDLRLRGIDPARAEHLVFPASSTEELRETELRLEPGRYEFRCGLPGHEEMRQQFDVTP